MEVLKSKEKSLSFKTLALIEEKTCAFIATNPFLQKSNEGRITEMQVRDYLHNILYSIRHTEPFLKTVVATCEKMGDTELAEFYREKIVEEAGHDRWVENDLRGFGEDPKDIDMNRVKATMKEFVASVKNYSETDPYLFFAYMTFAEYFTVLSAPYIVSSLVDNCGINESHLSVITLHEKIDKDHIKDDASAIDQFIAGRVSDEKFLEALEYFADCIGRLFVDFSESMH